MASVAFDSISKRFGSVQAVSGLSLDIEDGEFFVLLGPSGCGKTTALRIIAGLEEPSDGAILIDGRRVNDVAAKDRDLAMVFQNYALYPHMNVHDNIAFGLRMRKHSREEIDRIVHDAASTLGILELLRRKPSELSGGQRQRVALGRAIVRRPRAFLMDEPLSNLDAKTRVQMRLELIKLHRRLEATVVYVTHDQVEAMTMGQRMAVMESGVLQQVGRPQEVYDRPVNLFVAEFIGSPAMNFLDAERDGDGLRAAGVPLALPAELAAAVRNAPAKDFVVGIRPEHLVPSAADGAAITFEGTIDVIESLGSEQHVTIALHDATLTAKLPASAQLTTGATLRLAVESQHIHLFDATTKERIGP